MSKKKIQFYTLKSNFFFLNWKVAKYTKNKKFFLLKFQGFTYQGSAYLTIYFKKMGEELWHLFTLGKKKRCMTIAGEAFKFSSWATMATTPDDKIQGGGRGR